MRTLFTVVVSLLALTSANSQPATTTPPERSTTLGSVQTEHPDWFTGCRNRWHDGGKVNLPGPIAPSRLGINVTCGDEACAL